MKNRAGLLQRWVCSLSVAFGTATALAAPAPNPSAEEDRKNLSQLFTRHGYVPVIIIDRDFIAAAKSEAEEKQIDLRLHLINRIRKESGISTSLDMVRDILWQHRQYNPSANLDPKTVDGHKVPAACLATTRIAQRSLMSLSNIKFVNGFPAYDLSRLNRLDNAVQRFVTLHEGFHCTDRRYSRTRAEKIFNARPRSGIPAQSRAEKMEQDFLAHKGEIFADVAAFIKLAQEGENDILPDIMAFRAAHTIAAHIIVGRQDAHGSGYVFAPEYLQRMKWPDRLVYTPHPHVAHNTALALSIAKDFVDRTGPEQLQTMQMGDIIQRAYAITEAAMPSSDAFRGLHYRLWDNARKAAGETTDPESIEELCGGPSCATEITAEQRKAGEEIYNRSAHAMINALEPYRRKPATLQPAPQG